MQLSAQCHLDASREELWAALNDVSILKRSIPGCDRLAWRDARVLDAELCTRIGTREIRLTGRITVSERDPPNGCRLTGEGQDDAGGIASGSAVVRLLPDDGGGTRLCLDVDATIGGALAHAGSRLTDATAQTFAEEFLKRLAAPVAPALALAAPLVPAGSPAAHPGLRPLIWVPTLIGLVFLMLALFARLGAA